MGAPKIATEHVGFRVPVALLERIDARCRRTTLNRSATITTLLSAGLDALEKETTR